MGQITLLLAIHNHQPDGNFDDVFATGYDDCYARILEALEAAPHVRASLHHTGPLIEWIEQKRPAYFARMRRLVERGQVEVLGGGFYEPMLAILPERDARGQIRMMGDWAERAMGVRPDGMWLAERVWEPGMPALLHSAGVRFTLLDDGHFRYAGESGPFQGYYVSDKAGVPVAIFPIDQKLRYALPFQPPAEAIQTILALREPWGDRDIVVTYGDDGEKFGMWPGTKEWVWDRGWLRDFFRLLGEHAGTIKTGHFGEVLRRTPPSGRIYLPTSSYDEMGEWSLPARAQARYLGVRQAIEQRGELEAARPFLRGGIWQGFLAKYPEANFMHKKMVFVSEQVARAIAEAPRHDDENQLMTRELYRAQCNCPYWHGLFGGLYLNYLRDAVFRHLLVAEAFADAALGRPAPSWATGRPAAQPGAGEAAPEPPAVLVEARDVDADLQDEIVIRTPSLALIVRPHEGGALQELAYRPKTFTLSNVLSRWPEGYHEKLRHADKHEEGAAPKSPHDVVRVKEPGLDKHLVYDRHTRYPFVDHVLAPDAQLDDFARGAAREISDFPIGRFRVVQAEGGEALRLAREGWIDWRRARVEKRFLVEESAFEVRWRIALEGAPTDVLFAPELPLTLLDGHSQERRYEIPGRDLSPAERELASRGAWHSVPSLSLVNQANGFRVDLRFAQGGAPFHPTVWRFPLETVSNSEGGFERIYQGSVIAPLFPLRLGAAPVEIAVRVEIADLPEPAEAR